MYLLKKMCQKTKIIHKDIRTVFTHPYFVVSLKSKFQGTDIENKQIRLYLND